MTITISTWIFPIVATIIMVALMLRPYRSTGTWDFGVIFRLLWVIPILAVWTLYFGILLLLRK